MLLLSSKSAIADTVPNLPESPWLIIPLVSSDPKVSTAAGAAVGYLHRFDSDSPVSKFFFGGNYSTTHSYLYGIGAKVYFDHDRNRLTGFLAGGKIKNSYSDFLGSGLPLQTTDIMRMFAGRYTRAVSNNWYLGAQIVSTNYVLGASDALAGAILDKIGLTGFQSNGIGLVAEYDTRNNQNSSTGGNYFLAHQIAYRTWLGGNVSFDAYHADFRHFVSLDDKATIAMQIKGRWSFQAPPSGFSSIQLRGYVRGQDTAQHMTMALMEGRYHLRGKWNLIGYGGIAVLYGDRISPSKKTELFPNLGAGVAYELNKEKMVLRCDIAMGSRGNRGFYLKLGQSF